MSTIKNILLVEDDSDDQAFFIDAISHIKNAVLQHVSGNGIEALDSLAHSTILPDIIFMDINMPMMNGLECLAQIQKIINLKGIPVVMLSTSIGNVELMRSLGASGFIKKPSSEIKLRARIEELVNLDFAANRQIGYSTFTKTFAN